MSTFFDETDGGKHTVEYSGKPFVYDEAYYASITERRYREMEQMKELVHTQECYSSFIVRALDDDAPPCGHCANCLGRPLLPETFCFESLEKALSYVNGLTLPIEPRKRWSASEVTQATVIPYVNHAVPEPPGVSRQQGADRAGRHSH